MCIKQTHSIALNNCFKLLMYTSIVRKRVGIPLNVYERKLLPMNVLIYYFSYYFSFDKEKLLNCYVGLFVKGWLEKMILLSSNGIDSNKWDSSWISLLISKGPLIQLPLYLTANYLILITNEMIIPYTNINCDRVQCLFGGRQCCVDFKCRVPTFHYIVFHTGLYNNI